ncbi:thioredoxin family protein [Cloacibacterium sp.]|uniref:thioredoxin family protein n=1 Tax=Cloacibacterium sp. TaxID=1913682 RepID=UPI0039E299F0
MQTDKPKNTVIFIYTDWCNYCKAMENTTFKHKKIIDKLNNEYYFTMLNAEEKQDIKFCGKTFHFKPTGTNTGIQELAETLGNIDGRVSYPILVILNSKNEIIFQHSNFLNSSEMILILEKIYH